MDHKVDSVDHKVDAMYETVQGIDAKLSTMNLGSFGKLFELL
jgi:hypothetical protein